MSIKEKLKKHKQKMKEQIQQGRIVSEQKRAEKLRKKANRLANMKEGTLKTMITGLYSREKPINVMRQEYERRKQRRNRKHSKENSKCKD